VVVAPRVGPDDVDQVLEDNDALARRGVDMLVDRGFTRIACITGPESTATARERAAGWRAQMIHRGLDAPDELLIYANFRVDGGRAAIARLLELPEPPQAVLATNNLVGVGALQGLAERQGSHDAIEVGVLGELPFATSNTSDISIVPLHPREMGLTAARLLIERVNGSASEHGSRVVLTQ
jgi:LacI family transcriptional regulator